MPAHYHELISKKSQEQHDNKNLGFTVTFLAHVTITCIFLVLLRDREYNAVDLLQRGYRENCCFWLAMADTSMTHSGTGLRFFCDLTVFCLFRL